MRNIKKLINVINQNQEFQFINTHPEKVKTCCNLYNWKIYGMASIKRTKIQ